MNASIPSTANEGLIPSYFVRHRRQLRALLIEQQAWFCVRDLARLLHKHITPQIIAQLDGDQRRNARLRDEPEEQVLVSESGVYALLLIYCYHPENRSLRQWLSNDVVPVLRDKATHDIRLPRRRMEQVLGQSLSVMDWQGRLWVGWSDAVRMAENSAHT